MNLSASAIAVLLIIGVVAGILSSMVGIGGGVVIVPALVFIPLFAMSQKMAQGTSLAMLLPPIGLFAVINYYKSGYVDFRVAFILCIAFIGGSVIGSKLVLGISDMTLKKIFGGFLMLLGIKFLFFNK